MNSLSSRELYKSSNIAEIVRYGTALSRTGNQEECLKFLDKALFYNLDQEETLLRIDPEWTRQRTETRVFQYRFQYAMSIIREASFLEEINSGTIITDHSRNTLNIHLSEQNRESIDSLIKLPKLKALFCSNNQLITLPTLPTTLQRLDCENNKLETLLPLPTTLQELNCANNELRTLPPLPKTLYYLNCRDNPDLDPNHPEILKARANGCQVYT